MEERRENRDGGVLSRENVSEGHARFHWIPVGRAGDGHPATLRLRDEVVSPAIAVGTKSGDRAPNRLRGTPQNLLGVEPSALERPAPKVVHNDIRVRDQTLDDRSIDGATDVQRHTELVPINAEV